MSTARQIPHASPAQEGAEPLAGAGHGLPDARIVALARAVCAPLAPLRRPFLRGRWRPGHLDRVAAATAALAARRGEIAGAEIPEAQRLIAARLRDLLDRAPPVADGLNSLAEFLGGRAASHRDRLTVLARVPPGPYPPAAA